MGAMTLHFLVLRMPIYLGITCGISTDSPINSLCGFVLTFPIVEESCELLKGVFKLYHPHGSERNAKLRFVSDLCQPKRYTTVRITNVVWVFSLQKWQS